MGASKFAEKLEAECLKQHDAEEIHGGYETFMAGAKAALMCLADEHAKYLLENENQDSASYLVRKLNEGYCMAVRDNMAEFRRRASEIQP